MTILGQTAPGGGITVYGNGWSFSNSDNSIIRYVRVRMGKIGTSGKDGLGIAEGDNMIFDHLSVSVSFFFCFWKRHSSLQQRSKSVVLAN